MMNLTKSKQRVADHGEVFTPAWTVEAMLDRGPALKPVMRHHVYQSDGYFPAAL